MSWVIRHAPNDLTASEMLVLMMLAEHADAEGGHAFPSVETLARETRCSKSAVQRSLKRLVERSVIAIEEPATRRLPNMYCFPVFRGSKMTPHNDSGVSFEQFRGVKTTPKPSDRTVSSIDTPNVVSIQGPTFDDFWSRYPRGKGGPKKLAADQWDKLTDDERRAAITALPLWNACDHWQRGYVRHAFRWLRNREFADDVPRDTVATNENGHGTGKLAETERIAGHMRYLREQATDGAVAEEPVPPHDTLDAIFAERGDR